MIDMTLVFIGGAVASAALIWSATKRDQIIRDLANDTEKWKKERYDLETELADERSRLSTLKSKYNELEMQLRTERDKWEEERTRLEREKNNVVIADQQSMMQLHWEFDENETEYGALQAASTVFSDILYRLTEVSGVWTVDEAGPDRDLSLWLGHGTLIECIALCEERERSTK